MITSSSEFTQLAGIIHHNGPSAVLSTVGVLITLKVMQLVRLEWFSRKPADVRRDIIALCEIDQRKGKRGKRVNEKSS